MYILNKYIQPGEQVLFLAKKIWSPILFLVLCFVLIACPIAPGMLFIKEAFIIRLFISLPFIFLLTFAFGAYREFKKSNLVLTDRRLLLSQGSFSFKTCNFPVAEIQGIILGDFDYSFCTTAITKLEG